MCEDVGQAILEPRRNRYLGEEVMMPTERDYSETTAREVDLAVRVLIGESYERAKQLLNVHATELVSGAVLLLERETSTPDDFPALIKAA